MTLAWPNQPFLCASPDGLASCDCCGEGLVKIKCPYCARDSPIAEVECLKDNKLNSNPKTFLPSPNANAVTGRDYSDFVLWSKKEMVVERTEPNENMESTILSKSKAFFINVILPEMTRSLISRQIPSKKIKENSETKRNTFAEDKQDAV